MVNKKVYNGSIICCLPTKNGRKEMLPKIVFATFLLWCGLSSPAWSQSWFEKTLENPGPVWTKLREDEWVLLDAEEMGATFRYHYGHGVRLHGPVRVQMKGGVIRFTVPVDGEEIEVPERFISGVRQHLLDMLKIGAARYFFFGDAGHAHLFLPEKEREVCDRFSKNAARLRCILNQDGLAAVYHTAETLKGLDAYRTNPTILPPDVREWISKRNVLGWFDGRPTEILPFDYKTVNTKSGSLAGVGHFEFSAHRSGDLLLFRMRFPDGTIFIPSFDISFEANPRFGRPPSLFD